MSKSTKPRKKREPSARSKLLHKLVAERKAHRQELKVLLKKVGAKTRDIKSLSNAKKKS